MSFDPLSSSSKGGFPNITDTPSLQGEKLDAPSITRDTIRSQDPMSSSESSGCLTFCLRQIASFFCWLFCCFRSSEQASSGELNKQGDAPPPEPTPHSSSKGNKEESTNNKDVVTISSDKRSETTTHSSPKKEEPKNTRDVVTIANGLITPDMNDQDKGRIITAIEDIPIEKRDEVVGYILEKCIKPNMSSWDRVDLIRTVTKLPESERNSLEGAFAQLITDDIKPFNGIGTLIVSIGAISFEQRQAVVAYALKLISSGMSGTEKAHIIDTVKDILIEKREEVLEYVLDKCKPNMDGWDRVDFIRTVAALDSKERSNLEKALALLIKDDMSGIGALIRSVGAISFDQRLAVVKRALPFILDGMSGRESAVIIKAVKDIFIKKKEDVLEYVLDKCTPNMDGWDRAALIETVADLDLSERSSLEGALALLIKDDIGGYLGNIGELIKSVGAISLDKRMAVVTDALKLILPSMNGRQKAKIIDAVKVIPIKKREETIANVLGKYTPDTTEWDKVNLIKQAAAQFSKET